jgi:hypothetical protein
MVCEWCSDRVEGCYNKDESDCDFKSLPIDVEMIKARIDSETDLIMVILRREYSVREDLLRARAEIFDRLGGIKIMKDKLKERFNEDHTPQNQMEFTRAFLAFKIQDKKLERAGK